MLLQQLAELSLSSLRRLVQKILALFHETELITRIMLEKRVLYVFLDGTNSLLVIRVDPNQELLSIDRHCIPVLLIDIVEYHTETFELRIDVQIELD